MCRVDQFNQTTFQYYWWKMILCLTTITLVCKWNRKQLLTVRPMKVFVFRPFNLGHWTPFTKVTNQIKSVAVTPGQRRTAGLSVQVTQSITGSTIHMMASVWHNIALSAMPGHLTNTCRTVASLYASLGQARLTIILWIGNVHTTSRHPRYHCQARYFWKFSMGSA